MDQLIGLISLVVISLKDPSFATVFICALALVVAALAVHGMARALKIKGD